MASRDFINVRMNPWYSEQNHNRELKLLGSFGQKGNTQNTVFCLFAPDAPGLKADEFPDERSVYFGTRPGRRRMFLEGLDGYTEPELEALLLQLRELDTEVDASDAEMLRKNKEEYLRVQDGNGIAEVMRELIAKYPAKPGTENEIPLLPVMPDLSQALNIASADSRGVLAVIHPAEGGEAMEQQLAPLIFEEGIAGRLHVVRLSQEEWAEARKIRHVIGGSDGPGLVFLAPDPFGLEGEVWYEIAADASAKEWRTEIHAALQKFQGEWRKLDRKAHLRQGAIDGITWTEFDPDIGKVAPIPIDQALRAELLSGGE